MTELFVTKVAALDWEALLPLLPSDRRDRVLACRREEDRRRCAGAGWLLQQALARQGIPPAQQNLTYNPWGKPQLPQQDLFFSLSHSGPLVLCAVADHPVGVDVDHRCPAAVARRHFAPEEQTAAPTDRLRIWTAKEAFLKALGVGLTIPLDTFRVELSPDTARLVQTQSPLPYRLHEYTLAPYHACLCTLDLRPELFELTIP